MTAAQTAPANWPDELALADADRVHVMHRTSKDGLGAAYLAGFAWG
jgi:dolichol-phosphate mannosyltransferase